MTAAPNTPPVISFRLNKADYRALSAVLGLSPGAEANSFAKGVVQLAISARLMEVAREIRPDGGGSFGICLSDEPDVAAPAGA